MAKEKDEDADRDPESKGEIHERWEKKGEISRRYTEAKSKLPDDPWAYTGLLSRNPAKSITLALVGTDTPLILVVLSVKDKSKTPQYIRRMLRMVRQHLNIGV